MNNGDYPANPKPTGINFEASMHNGWLGLTKREHFAGLAMAAWIQHHGTSAGYGYSDKEMSLSAVMSADALLKELDK